MTDFKISEELSLPHSAVTERLGWFGTSGSGKTYGAGKLAELMLAAGAQVIILDPVGVWWGLRSSADGKRAGIPIHFFGGVHGDLPLLPQSGEIIADLIVDKGISAVLDVSDFTIGGMSTFVRGWGERFFDRKKRSPSPVHLYLEEAHTFLPQNLPPDPQAAIMLHRVERIVRVGRNYGIGTSQISQQPQAVTTRTRNQIQCLFAFGTNGKHERKAIADWFDQHGGSEVADELSSLPTGIAWAVSPRWLKKTVKIKIAPKTTFDSSATPEFGASKSTTPKVLAPVDIEALRTAMADVVAAAQADDPKPLRKRIAELEAQLAKAQSGKPVVDHGALERARAQGEQAATKRLGEQLERANRRTAHVARELKGIEVKLAALAESMAGATEQASPPAPRLEKVTTTMAVYPGSRAAQVPVVVQRRAAPETQTASTGDVGLATGARRILAAVAQHGEEGVTREQLGVLTEYKKTSRDTYVKQLKAAGLITQDGERLTVTDKGIEALGDDYERLPTGSALLDHWRKRLPEGERKILDIVVDAYPDDIDRESLGERTNYKKTSRDTYVKKLAARKLVQTGGGRVLASAMLFDGGAA